MLLKDCPIGSFVRLVSICGKPVMWQHWHGTFRVKKNEFGEKYVTDGKGMDRSVLSRDPDFQFEIVTLAPPTPNTITINGKTYKLKPHTEPRLTVIDGVTYEMEEI